jgi:hypothetical protein
VLTVRAEIDAFPDMLTPYDSGDFVSGDDLTRR